MKTFSLIIEILFVGLLIAALITIIKYPKDIIRGFLNFIRPSASPIAVIFLPIWLIAWTLNKVFNLKIIEQREGVFDTKSEEPYKSTKNLKFDFGRGTKYLITNEESNKASKLVNEFLGFSYAKISVDDFTIEGTSPTILRCPNNIPFYDFNLLVQHSNNELGIAKCYGLFYSDEISFYCYQDPITTHNIIGKINNGQKFSVYTLDDLNKKVWLKLNNQISVRELDIKNGV